MKYKVGDSLKIITDMFEGIGVYKGATILVVQECETEGQWLDRRGVEAEALNTFANGKYFELVEEEKVNNKFAIGDQVISIKNTPSIPEGFIGTVAEINTSSYPIAVTSKDGQYSVFEEDELELLSVGKQDFKDIKIPHDSVGLSFDDPKMKVTPADFTGIVKPQSALDKQVSGNHYKDCKIQPIEYIHANGLNYFEGNSIKYITRHRKKNGKADILKAIHYLELLLELEYKDKE